jgi:hypothetical protein
MSRDISLSALALAAAIVGAEGSVGAAPPPPSSVLAAEADLRDALSQLDARGARPLALEVNPLMAIIGSGVSANFELVPATHLGLVASPRASVVMPAWVAEAGVRYWSGDKRQAAGFFVGPSLVYGRTRGEALYGVALDVGVQTIFDSGLTLGAGIGVEILRGALGTSALDVGPLASDVEVPNAVLPRLLFSVGYSL